MPVIAVPRRWIRRIRDLLEPDEDVELAISEHKAASPKPLTTAVIFCTTKRLILARWGSSASAGIIPL